MKHSKISYFLLPLFLLLFLSINIIAQNPNFPIVSMNIQTLPVANDTSGGIPDLSDSTIFAAEMIVSLIDTTVIDEIYVVLSDSNASTTLLQHTFYWDVFGASGNGTTYARTYYNLVLGLGNFMALLHYSASIRIKRTDGSFTDYITFSR